MTALPAIAGVIHRNIGPHTLLSQLDFHGGEPTQTSRNYEARFANVASASGWHEVSDLPDDETEFLRAKGAGRGLLEAVRAALQRGPLNVTDRRDE